MVSREGRKRDHGAPLTDIDIEVHELHTEDLPVLALGPNQQDARGHRRDEVVGPPPALDPRAVHLQDGLADRQGTVVPYQQEYEGQLQGSAGIKRRKKNGKWEIGGQSSAALASPLTCS